MVRDPYSPEGLRVRPPLSKAREELYQGQEISSERSFLRFSFFFFSFFFPILTVKTHNLGSEQGTL